MRVRIQQRNKRRRRGALMLELLLAAVVIMALLGFATTICYRVGLVWRDVRQHRVAVAELSNQLDLLTRMSEEDAKLMLESIAPSEYSKRTLNEPRMTGELVESKLGTQINLRLDWKRRHPGKPVELVGWIQDPQVAEED